MSDASAPPIVPPEPASDTASASGLVQRVIIAGPVTSTYRRYYENQKAE
jgi:hypothetical protein